MADLTYRPLTAADLWVRGDILGGALLREGLPVDVRTASSWAAGAIVDSNGGGEPYVVGYYRCGEYCIGEHERAGCLRLDCTRPEVRDRARRVLLPMGHDLGPIIDAELRGEITPGEAAGLVWCSILRVGAGLPALRGWRTTLDAAIAWCLPGAPKDVILRAEHSDDARLATLAAGFALREPSALLLPLPGGVVGRLEVSDG